jgi:hypothetical protein
MLSGDVGATPRPSAGSHPRTEGVEGALDATGTAPASQEQRSTQVHDSRTIGRRKTWGLMAMSSFLGAARPCMRSDVDITLD